MRSVTDGPILLTPGPVTLTARVRAAMMEDRTSGEPVMRGRLRFCRETLVALAGGGKDFTAIPVAGSATYANEAVIRTFLPPGGEILIVTNGAYGDWLIALARTMNIPHAIVRTSRFNPVCHLAVEAALARNPRVTHVMMVHLETSSGLVNPLERVAEVCHRTGRGLLVDAVASFGALPIDVSALGLHALILSSNKCLQGPPGLAWVVAGRDALEACRGHSRSLSLDLWDQVQSLDRVGFRFTPPNHVLSAVAVALSELQEEGRSARLKRYQANWSCLVSALREAGLETLLPDQIAAPVVATFWQPPSPFSMAVLEAELARRGFIAVPGRLAVEGTFRVGCIGAITVETMRTAASAIIEAVNLMGILNGQGDQAPAT